MNNQFDILIIGASASGLACAINAKRLCPEKEIAILEALPKIGKKLLATGNGRCNLTNLNALNHPYKNQKFAGACLKRYSPQRTLEFFRSLGLLTFTDDCSRVYPLSNTATSVLDVLRFAAESLNIHIFCDTKAQSVEKINDVFIVNNSFRCKKLVVATGGCASPAQGSDGSGYILLKALGHSITELYPSLVQLTSPEKQKLRPLKGVRVHDAIVKIDNHEVRGELLFTDYGLSGIASMEISQKIEGRDNLTASIDLVPSMSEKAIADFLKGVKLNASCMLLGILPKAVSNAVLKQAKIDESKSSNQLSFKELIKVSHIIKNFKLQIDGTKGFNFAQVTSGGARVSEFNRNTLESNLVPSLYCTGEILDVDGGCGGFNLQWAWSSGLTAGEQIVK